MDSKLTLKLDTSIIENAKTYAKDNDISLSKMIENYLQAVTTRKYKEKDVTPLVKSLTGVIQLDNLDNKKDYTDYLSNKYK
jgi:hypothetical protein